MYLLHRIGPRHSSNWNSLEEIRASTGPLSFDGIYSELLFYADDLIGRDITLFVMGAYVGRDNSFDVVTELPGQYLNWPEIRYLAKKLNAEIGYHSWSHKDLTLLSDNEIRVEIRPPFPMKKFAYPHGRVDARVAKIVEEEGYEEAFAAGPFGDGSRFQRKRRYLNW